MEEKKLILFEKMYTVIQEMKSTMATKQDLEKVHHKIMVMEQSLGQGQKALHDGFKLSYEKLADLKDEVRSLKDIVKSHDIEIRVLKNKAHE